MISLLPLHLIVVPVSCSI